MRSFRIRKAGVRSKYWSRPSRFASLTALYSQFAQSDEVRALVRREGAPSGSSVSAAPVIPPGSNAYALMPVSHCSAQPIAHDAIETTRSEPTPSWRFWTERREAEIPESQRVQVDVLAQPRGAAVIEPRKKTLPIVVFLTVITGTIGLVFVLENLRSRVRPVPDAAAGESAAVTDARRTA